jgi:MraZ protein
MLLGEYEHTIDDKNRLTLPAKFRTGFADGVVLAFNHDGCLEAYPTAQYEETISTRIKGIDPISKEAKIMRRAYFSAATMTEMDKQGRVVLPAGMAQRAGIDKDVVVAGLYDYLEIWDREAWQKQRNEVEGRIEDVAERLAKLD